MKGSLLAWISLGIIGLWIVAIAIVTMPRMLTGMHYQPARFLMALSGILIALGPILKLFNIDLPVPMGADIVFIGIGLFPLSIVTLVLTNLKRK